MRTPSFGVRCVSSTSGVLPTSSSSEVAVMLGTAAGHRGQQDHRRVVRDGCVESLRQRAHVLALEVHVDERRDVAVLDELVRKTGITRDEIVNHRAHGLAARVDLALAADLRAERGWEANRGHACARGPAQNWT